MSKGIYIGVGFMILGAIGMSAGNIMRMQEQAVEVATKEQHVRDLKSIFSIYEEFCDADTPEAIKRSDEFCNGVRESYWKTQSHFWRQDLP